MSKLIIVCGLPGSGKTTLATQLSKKLNIVCLHKDAFMERLYLLLGMSTMEDSKKIGALSVKLMFGIIEDMLEQGIDIMVESPFNFADDYALFQQWIDRYKITLTTVICSISTEERLVRFKNRPRHASHHDDERDMSVFAQMDELIYDSIPGNQIRITSDKPVDELVETILQQLA